jgi:oligoendopeptidase F
MRAKPMPKNRAVKQRAKNGPAHRKTEQRKTGHPKTGLGSLPEWNLADLYSGLDDPAIRRDLDRIDAECVAFEGAFKGKLAELAQSAQAGDALAEAVR